MRWPDVDLERRAAWVHADEAKGGQAIGVPLNDEAMAAFRQEARKHPTYVFTFRRRPLASANTKAWKNALRRFLGCTFHRCHRHGQSAGVYKMLAQLQYVQPHGATSDR